MTRLMGWNSNIQEPKRTNRWELVFIDDEELRLSCYSASMPKIEFDTVPVDRMHNTYKVSGSKVKYADITLKFYDFVDNQAARALDDWYQTLYTMDQALMGYPVEYKRNLQLVMYSPDHQILETWELIGCWPTSFTRPELSWKDGTNIVDVSVNLSIDEAKLVLSA